MEFDEEKLTVTSKHDSTDEDIKNVQPTGTINMKEICVEDIKNLQPTGTINMKKICGR